MVGSNGCDLIKTVEALLRFPLNKAGMPGKATAYLDQIAAQAKEDKDLKIIVKGRTDETGSTNSISSSRWNVQKPLVTI